MRCIRGQRGEVSARAGKSLDLNHQFVSKRVESISGREADVLVHIDAVDNDRRIGVILLSLAIRLDDETIVFNRRFRTDAADKSDSLHVLRIRYESLSTIEGAERRLNLARPFQAGWLGESDPRRVATAERFAKIATELDFL